DLLLVMTVNPGYGGQPFIASMLPKVRRARERIAASAGPADLEVDGGVDPSNARALVEAGATVLVAGTSVFAGGDVAANVARPPSRPVDAARVGPRPTCSGPMMRHWCLQDGMVASLSGGGQRRGGSPGVPNAPDERWSAGQVAAGLRVAATWLRAHAERLNALNVYPVPDGDTGTNMSLTLQAAAEAADPASDSLPEVVACAARAALMGS